MGREIRTGSNQSKARMVQVHLTKRTHKYMKIRTAETKMTLQYCSVMAINYKLNRQKTIITLSENKNIRVQYICDNI